MDNETRSQIEEIINTAISEFLDEFDRDYFIDKFENEITDKICETVALAIDDFSKQLNDEIWYLRKKYDEIEKNQNELKKVILSSYIQVNDCYINLDVVKQVEFIPNKSTLIFRCFNTDLDFKIEENHLDSILANLTKYFGDKIRITDVNQLNQCN